MREDILSAKHEKLAKLNDALGSAYPEKAARSHTTQAVPAGHIKYEILTVK